MTNLSANAPLRVLGEAHTHKFLLDTSSAQTLYKGVPLVIDQNVDAVNVRTAEGVTCVDGDVFMGIAAESKSVASGAAETTEVEAYTWPTILGFKSAVCVKGDSGKPVYMSDTGTLSLSNGAYPEIGELFTVDDGYAFVKLNSPKVLSVP